MLRCEDVAMSIHDGVLGSVMMVYLEVCFGTVVSAVVSA